MCGNWQHFTITMNTWKSILSDNQFCLSISCDLRCGFKWPDWLWGAVNFIFWVVVLTLWWHLFTEGPFSHVGTYCRSVLTAITCVFFVIRYLISATSLFYIHVPSTYLQKSIAWSCLFYATLLIQNYDMYLDK